MDARDTETPAAHRGGETATTKLSRIADNLPQAHRTRR